MKAHALKKKQALVFNLLSLKSMTIAFVSCIFLGNRSGSESSICSRRRSPRASAEQPGSDQNWSGNNWTISGKTFESQQEQTIEFVIRPGGLVEETVTGVRGEACEKVS